MSKRLRVLQIEDSESDAALIVRLLEKDGYDVHAERVETAEQMRGALEGQSWEVIVADYRLPKFDAPSALSILQQTGKDIPFIVVSGAIGEETAVSIMKSGAHDYLLKDRLERLAPAVAREIREARSRQRQRQAEEERNAAYSELAAINANAPVMLLVVNAEFRVEKVNKLASQVTGRPAHEPMGETPGELIGCVTALRNPGGCGAGPGCKECAVRKAVSDTLGNDISHHSIETWKQLLVGDVPQDRCLLFSTTPLVLGHNRKVLICAQDITPLKQTEQDLRMTVDRLELALNERAVLFQEIHHRVKNNLQIIASLLSMQARLVKHRETVDKLKDTEHRVKSMALIHEQLYNQKDIGSVDFADYIQRLAPRLLSSYERADPVSLRLDLEPTKLTLDRSIPCGLILNELITNALKYAYPKGKGEIVVSLSSDAGDVKMTVSDSGAGLPVDFDWRKSKSLGMTIVQALTKQLNGKLEVGPPPGAVFTLRIPSDARRSTPDRYSSSVAQRTPQQGPPVPAGL
jgi:two-component sensor histidine kinase